ncbi:MAG: hypothetical protein FD136_650 [Chitinophagaceae bacterium]|nr:MAG: hypothetical protein FD136_650 [Chitinophagaceae bacterium]
MNIKFLNTNSEVLRGFAALMVVLGLIIQLSFIFNGDNEFIHSVFHYMFPTITMVLVFFLLSSYVMGSNYGKQHYFYIKLYLQKN